MNPKLLQMFLFIVAVMGLIFSVQARTWKSEKYNIEAEYVRYSDQDGGKVYVKKDSDGKIVYLEMNLLSESDQKYVLDLQSAARGVSNESAMKGMAVVPAAQRHALLIGINGYKSPVSPLKYCMKDMQDLSVALQNAGFTPQNIRLMVDSSPDDMKPTAQNILAEVEKTASSMKEGDFLFVAFSGHGVMLDDDQSYLCPIDVDRTNRSSFVSREKIFQLLDSSEASCKVFLCDACRDAFTIKGLGGRTMLKTRSISDSVNMNQHGFILMSSCSEKQQSMEHDRFGNDVFTHYLLEGLKGGAASSTTGNVSVMGLFNFAAEQTTIFTRGAQTPTFRNSGEMSNFIIAKLDRARIQAEAPTIQIDDITGKISWGKIEIQPTKPIFVENIALPSVPVGITKTRVEIQLIQEAIKQLNDGTHPALQQSKTAVEQAKLAYYQVEKSFNELDQPRRESWSALPEETQKTLFDRILQNPDITISSARDLCPEEMSYIDFKNLLEQGKSLAPVHVKFTKAKAEYARIQAEAASKLQAALNDLETQLKQKEGALPDLIEQFQTEALLAVMEKCPGYDNYEAEFPFEFLISRIPALEQYEFGWKEKELFDEAEVVWTKNRPCIKKEFERRGWPIPGDVTLTSEFNPNPKQYEKLWEQNGITGKIAISCNGKMAITCGNDIKILVFSTGEVLQTIKGHTNSVSSVSYSPDGRFLASGSGDKTVCIWNAQTGECVKTLEGHTKCVRSVSYSPDGRFIASGGGRYGDDYTVRIWNAQTGECVKTLEGNTGYVTSVSYSPDGKYLSVGAVFCLTVWRVAE